MARRHDKAYNYVVSNLHVSLLGNHELGMLAKVDAVDAIKEFPKLFQGLGRLEGNYHIKVKEEAELFSLTTPRRVAIPLMQPVKQELQRMEDLRVIARVDEPTEWCSGMVVVPKKNGRVRIYVDFNQNVCQERHIMPDVEQTLAQLAGAKVFLKLDANSGFWQIPLSPESAKLTTFITPFGRYCFHRLPLGTTSAGIFSQEVPQGFGLLSQVGCELAHLIYHAEKPAKLTNISGCWNLLYSCHLLRVQLYSVFACPRKLTLS